MREKLSRSILTRSDEGGGMRTLFATAVLVSVFFVAFLGCAAADEFGLVTSSGVPSSDTIYTYTGSPYSYCAGIYSCNGATPHLSVMFDIPLSGTQLDNLSYQYIQGLDPLAVAPTYNITDHADINLSVPGALLNLSFSTDGNGNIMSWDIEAQENPTIGRYEEIETFNPPNCSSCGNGDMSNFGFNDGQQLVVTGYGGTESLGTWTAAPEPSSLVLIGTGLLSLLPQFRRRRCNV